MESSPLTLTLLPEQLGVCRLPPDAEIPDWAWNGPVQSVTRTAEELSVVCAAAGVPDGVRAECGWRALKVEGPLDFSLVGVLASLAGTLAAVEVSIFVLSTFDTDYLLVKAESLETAVEALRAAGCRVLLKDC
ncbi:MAG TPA: ACT domain-containing protein [Anaerolineaceae bacterium]|nr:ACT domain-containing protein [Anaerolineaceae bacterium]